MSRRKNGPVRDAISVTSSREHVAYAYRGAWKEHYRYFAEAIEHFQRALDLNPGNPMARQSLASLMQPSRSPGQ